MNSGLIQGNGDKINEFKEKAAPVISSSRKDIEEPDDGRNLVQKDSVCVNFEESEVAGENVTVKDTAVTSEFVWSTCNQETINSKLVSNATVKTSTVLTSVSQGITYTVSQSETEHKSHSQGTNAIPHASEPLLEQTVKGNDKILGADLNTTQLLKKNISPSSPLNQTYKHFPNSKVCALSHIIPSSAGNVIDFTKQLKVFNKDPPPYPGLPNRKVITSTKSAIPGPISHIIVVNGGKTLYSYQVQVKQEAVGSVQGEIGRDTINTTKIIDETTPCLTPAIDTGIYDEVDGDIPTIKAETDENTDEKACESGDSSVVKIEKVLVNEKKKQFGKVRNADLELGFGHIKTEASISNCVREALPDFVSFKTDFNRNLSSLNQQVFDNQVSIGKDGIETGCGVGSYESSSLETENSADKADENISVAYHSVGTQSCMTLRNRENKSFKRLHELRKEILNGAYVKDVYDADEIVDPEPLSKLRKTENKDVIHIKELIEERRRKKEFKKLDNYSFKVAENQKRKKTDREKTAAYRQRKIVQKSYTNCGFECKVCGKLLTTPYGLQNHLMVHEGQKPFVCKVCNHAFTKQWNLKTHLQNRHKIEPTKKDLEPKAPVNLSTKGAFLRRVSREDIPEGVSVNKRSEASNLSSSVSDETLSNIKVESVEENLFDSKKLEKTSRESIASDNQKPEKAVKEQSERVGSFDNADLIDEYLSVNDIENSSFEGSEDNIFDLNEADFLEIKQLETDVDLETMVNKGTVIGPDDTNESVNENLIGIENNMANENVIAMEKGDLKSDNVLNGAVGESKAENFDVKNDKDNAEAFTGSADKTMTNESGVIDRRTVPKQDVANTHGRVCQEVHPDLKIEASVSKPSDGTPDKTSETNECVSDNLSSEQTHATIQDASEGMALQNKTSAGASSVMPQVSDNLTKAFHKEGQANIEKLVNNENYSETATSFNTGPSSSTDKHSDLISTDSSQVGHKEQSIGAVHQSESLPPPPYSEAVQSVTLPPEDPYSPVLNSHYRGQIDQYAPAQFQGQPGVPFDQNMYSAHLANLAQNQGRESEDIDGQDPAKDRQMFECQACGKKLTSTGALQTHMRIHTGEKPYRCEICNRAFSFKSNCTRHMLTHTQGRQKKSPPKNGGTPSDGQSNTNQTLPSFGDIRMNTEVFPEPGLQTSPMSQSSGMLPPMQTLVANQAPHFPGMQSNQFPHYSQTSTPDSSQEGHHDATPKPDNMAGNPYGMPGTEYQHHQQHPFYQNHPAFYDQFGPGAAHFHHGAFPPPVSPMQQPQLPGNEYPAHMASQSSYLPEHQQQQHPDPQAAAPSPQQMQQVQKMPTMELKPETPLKQKNRSKEYQGERKHPSKYCDICKKSFSASYYTNHMKMHSGTSPHICTLCHQVFSQKFSLTRHIENIHHKTKQESAQMKVVSGPDINQQMDATNFSQPSVSDVKKKQEKTTGVESLTYRHGTHAVPGQENAMESAHSRSHENIPSIELTSSHVPGHNQGAKITLSSEPQDLTPSKNQLETGHLSNANQENMPQFQDANVRQSGMFKDQVSAVAGNEKYQSQTSPSPQTSNSETHQWPTSLPSIQHLQQMQDQRLSFQQMPGQGQYPQPQGQGLHHHAQGSQGHHLFPQVNLQQQQLSPGQPSAKPAPPSNQSSLEEGEPEEMTLKQQQPTEKGKGSHVCTVCNKLYSSAATLKAHHRIHTGEKPYTCNFCDKAFTFKGNMKQHVQKHHKEALSAMPGVPAMEVHRESSSAENSLHGMKTPTKKSRKSPAPMTAGPGFGFSMSETAPQFDIPSQEYKGYCNSPLYKHPIKSDPEPFVSMQPAMYSYQSRSPLHTLGTRTPPQLYPTPPPQSYSGSPVKSLPSIHNFNKVSSSQAEAYADVADKRQRFPHVLGSDIAQEPSTSIKTEAPTSSDGLPAQIANAVLGMQQEGLGGPGLHPPEYPGAQSDLKNWQDHSFPPVLAIKTEENENSNIAPSIGDLEKTVMPLVSEESQTAPESQAGAQTNIQGNTASAVPVSQAHNQYSQSGASLHQAGTDTDISQSKPQISLEGLDSASQNFQASVPMESPAMLQSPHSSGTPMQSPHPSTPGTPIISPQANPFSNTISPQTNATGNPLASPKQKSIVCPVCNKELAYSSSLSTHMRVHTGEKPFSCHLCNKNFAQRSNLNTHLKSCRKKNESKEGTPELAGLSDGQTGVINGQELSDMSGGESLSRKPSSSSDASMANYDIAMDLSQHHGNQPYPPLPPPQPHMQGLDYNAQMNYENPQAGLNMHYGQFSSMYSQHPNTLPSQETSMYSRELEHSQYGANSMAHPMTSTSISQPSSSSGNALPNFSSVFSNLNDPSAHQGYQYPQHQQQLPGFDSFKSSYKGDTLPLPQEFPTDLTEKPVNMSMHQDLPNLTSPTRETKPLPSLSDWGSQLKPDNWLTETKPKPLKQDGRRRSSAKVLSDGEKTAARTCKECGKVLSCIAGLRHHMRIHTGEKPYRCGLCSKRFSQKCNTHTHIKSCIKTQMSKGNLPEEHLTKSEQDLCILFTIQEPESKLRSSVEESSGSEFGMDQQEDDSNSRFGSESLGGDNTEIDIVSKGNNEDGKSNTELVKQALMEIIDKATDKQTIGPHDKSNDINTQNRSSVAENYLDPSEVDESDRLTPKFLDKDNIRGVDSGYKRRKCTECGVEITGTPSSLKHHMRTHTKEKPFVCDYCCRPFSMKFSLNRHINTQHGENRHAYKSVEKRKLSAEDQPSENLASKEAKQFKSENSSENVCEFSANVETKEIDKEMPSKVTTDDAQNCPENVEKVNELTRQSEGKNDLGDAEIGKYSQQTLGVKTDAVSEMKEVKIEMKQDAKVKVKKSKYPIIDEAAIAAMEITKRGLKVCEICNKEFARPVLLLKHMRVHTNAEKPFKCVMCNKAFGYKSSLKTHFEKHKAEMFKCNVCEELYVTESELAEHSVSHSWEDCPDIDAV